MPQMTRQPTGLPRLHIARASFENNRRVRSVTFKANTTWVVPAGVYIVQSVEGRGSNGTPESGTHNYVDGYDKFRQRVYSINGGAPQTDPETFVGTFTGSTPAGYCDPAQTTTDGNGNFIDYNYCYRFEDTLVDVGNYQAPTNGTAATGFGKSFPGGIGGPAPTTRHYALSVVPGQSVLLVVPTGGIITIAY
jgi:hypothetical protein